MIAAGSSISFTSIEMNRSFVGAAETCSTLRAVVVGEEPVTGRIRHGAFGRARSCLSPGGEAVE
jgi:hypothetical protein